jgi:hypothetical protein
MSQNGLSRDAMSQNAMSQQLYCLEPKCVSKTETVSKFYINVTWILDPPGITMLLLDVLEQLA